MRDSVRKRLRTQTGEGCREVDYRGGDSEILRALHARVWVGIPASKVPRLVLFAGLSELYQQVGRVDGLRLKCEVVALFTRLLSRSLVAAVPEKRRIRQSAFLSLTFIAKSVPSISGMKTSEISIAGSLAVVSPSALTGFLNDRAENPLSDRIVARLEAMTSSSSTTKIVA